MAQWGRAQLNFISLRSLEQKSEINKRDAYGRLMDPQRERETKRVKGKVSLHMSDERGNIGVAERALTSAQLHITT